MPGIPEVVVHGFEAAKALSSLKEAYDCTVLLTSNVEEVLSCPQVGSSLQAYARLDSSVTNSSKTSTDTVHVIAASDVPGERLLLVKVPSLLNDAADARLLNLSVASALKKAKEIGSTSPLVLLHGIPDCEDFSRATEATILGALASLYEPIQARETTEDELEPVTKIGFILHKDNYHRSSEEVQRFVTAIEIGRRLARDVGGSDPERMSPEKIVQHLKDEFKGVENVSLRVVDSEQMKTEYPLASAVGRCSLMVERHWPRIVRLEYTGSEECSQLVLLAGKGIVYDSGGADVKVGGSMAGMSRDKCGAANVAGFVRSIAELKPKNLHVIAELGFVRNSCGADSYVADEVITGHSGVRVKIINTDAEGRLVLADCLSHLRIRAEKASEKEKQVYSCATLTGHAVRSVGAFSIAMDNGPARASGTAASLQSIGTILGDPVEVSMVRREDFEANKGKNSTHDIRNLGTPAVDGSRGHQYAAAFLTVSSGLDKHGRDSDCPLPYTHLDIAGGGVERADYKFGNPTGSPIMALVAKHFAY